MSRDAGFAVADISVNLYDDDKVKRLHRELDGDLGRIGHAMMLREVTLLASWRDGCRRDVDGAAPLWLVVDEDLVGALIRVGLLDRTRKTPSKSWKTWFGPAFERREKRRRAGALGGRPTQTPPIRAQEPPANHPVNNRKPSRLSTVNPDRPSFRPSDRPPRAPARETAPSNNGATREAGFEAVRQTAASLGLVK